MQTLVYIIGGYCLIKAVLLEIAVIFPEFGNKPALDGSQKLAVLGATAFLFLAAIEAFNQ